jgi:hypothetical protein
MQTVGLIIFFAVAFIFHGAECIIVIFCLDSRHCLLFRNYADIKLERKYVSETRRVSSLDPGVPIVRSIM